MTMARTNLAQDQTVEDILASIRRAIDDEGSRSASAVAHAATESTPPGRIAAASVPTSANGTVTPIRGAKKAMADNDAAPAPGEKEASKALSDDRGEMQDVIEMAIEQALDALNPDPKPTESPLSATANARPPRLTATRPRVEPRPPREAPRVIEQTPRLVPPPPSRSLLSPRANAAVAASFGDLTRVLASRGARDIDHAVEDLLRPMLKNWLEDNLPSLVERLVREEIERVSRGGR